MRHRHSELSDQKMKIHMLHKVALFLRPTFNKLKMLTPTEVSEVHPHILTLLEEDEGEEATTTTFENEDEAHTSSTLSPLTAKRKRSSFFAE